MTTEARELSLYGPNSFPANDPISTSAPARTQSSTEEESKVSADRCSASMGRVARALRITPLRRRRRDNEQGRKRRSVADRDDDRQEYRVVTSWCLQDFLNVTGPSSSGSKNQVESYPTKPP